jgi:hypothetical protein
LLATTTPGDLSVTTEAGWYYRDFARGSPIKGPFTIDEIAERAQTGEVAHNSLVRFESGEWHQADQIAVLISALRERRGGRRAIDVELIKQEVQASRRRLNWVTLFFVAVLLSLVGGVLIAEGISHWRSPALLAGQIVSAVAGVFFLCAIIRWAIDPLFAQLVDTNDQLARIAALLKENHEQNE